MASGAVASPPSAGAAAGVTTARDTGLRVVASIDSDSHNLAVDATHIYAAGTKELTRTLRSGGTPEVILPGPRFLQDMAVDEENVFWITGGSPYGEVFAWKKNGEQQAREIANLQAGPYAIAVDATHLYWANVGRFKSASVMEEAAVRRMPKAGGPVETILADANGVRSLLLDGDAIYVLLRGPKLHGDNGSLIKLPKRGGRATVLAPSGVNPYDLAADETHIYWSLRGPYKASPSTSSCSACVVIPIMEEGQVQRVPKAGGAVEVIASGLRDAASIAVGERSLLLSASGGVYEFKKTPGSSPTLLTDMRAHSRFAVVGDEAYVQLGDKLVAFRR